MNKTDTYPKNTLELIQLFKIISGELPFQIKTKEAFKQILDKYPIENIFLFNFHEASSTLQNEIFLSKNDFEKSAVLKTLSTFQDKLKEPLPYLKFSFGKKQILILKSLFFLNEIEIIYGYTCNENDFNLEINELIITIFDALLKLNEQELLYQKWIEQSQIKTINGVSKNTKENLYTILNENKTLRKIQNDLIEAKIKAEENDKLKSAFLANMSHEIRTPLNAIIGFSNLLSEHNSDKLKKERYANIINSNSKQLLTIINDIVDISKLESGQIEINPSKINLNHVFENLQISYLNQLKINKSHVKLICTKPSPDKDAFILTDYTRINQILNNLICNALKFTSEGFVEYGYEMNGSSSVRFFVKDSGIGITENMKQLIFEPFVQESDEVSKKFGGNGLGLAICKKLVEKLNGKIWMESTKNIGSSFYFTLPKNYK